MSASLATALPVFADMPYYSEGDLETSTSVSNDASPKKVALSGVGVTGLVIMSFGVLRYIKNKKK